MKTEKELIEKAPIPSECVSKEKYEQLNDKYLRSVADYQNLKRMPDVFTHAKYVCMMLPGSREEHKAWNGTVYELMPMARFTAIGQMYYINKQFRPALTVAYSGSFFRFLNFTASYTASKYSGNYVGAGLSLNFGPLNIYAVTDNIMILTKINAPTAELATSYDAANVRFGIVFTLGRVKK